MAVMQSLSMGLKSMNQANEDNRDSLKKILGSLQRRTGKVAELESYTITSFEVERLERIGFGGFSEVWRGQWRGAIVAIKIFDSKTSERDVKNEVSVWGGLSHPNVIGTFKFQSF